MDSSNGLRHDDTEVAHDLAYDSPELRRLVKARSALDHARRQAKWKRKCKTLQSATHEVQLAALAAHNAGIGWTQIGDVLGIKRAMTPARDTHISATTLLADTESGRHRAGDVAPDPSNHFSAECDGALATANAPTF